MENMFIGIIIIAAVFGIAVMLYVTYSERWTDDDPVSDYRTHWFNSHQFCPRCGRELAWVTENKIQYDTEDGRPYRMQTWSCVIANHTNYGHMGGCSRRNYETPA